MESKKFAKRIVLWIQESSFRLWLVVAVITSILAWTILYSYYDPSPDSADERHIVVQDVALIVAGVLGLIGIRNTLSSFKEQARLQEDSIQETTLQTCFQQIGDMVLSNGLCESQPKTNTSNLARAYILTTLRRIDGDRKARLVRFLWTTGLIDSEKNFDSPRHKPVIVLSNAQLDEANFDNIALTKADLGRARLRRASFVTANFKESNFTEAVLTNITSLRVGFESVNLCKANLSGATLHEANLTSAILREAKLINADLTGADLTGADLTGADLTGADLTNAVLHKVEEGIGAIITQEQLDSCKSIQGATLPPTLKSNLDVREI